jgi:hypothetical protein
MWLEKIPPIDRQPSQSAAVDSTDVSSADVSVTVAELKNQRATAIQKMVASIATHDFISARRYSYEETRLANLLQNLQNEKSVGAGRDLLLTRLPVKLPPAAAKENLCQRNCCL